MAELTNRLPINTAGRFYVDDTCIDCDMCRANVPEVFAYQAEALTSYVYRQPQTPEETARALEMVECCPVEAIGHDGEEAGAVA